MDREEFEAMSPEEQQFFMDALMMGSQEKILDTLAHFEDEIGSLHRSIEHLQTKVLALTRMLEVEQVLEAQGDTIAGRKVPGGRSAEF